MKHKIAIVVGCLFCLLVATRGHASAAKTFEYCRSPKSIGGWIGPVDAADVEIRLISALETADTGYVLGWFYRLNNSKVYFQPSFALAKEAHGGVSSMSILTNHVPGAPSVLVSRISPAAAGKAVLSIASSYDIPESGIPQPFSDFANGKLSTQILSCRK